ncbi:MAG TPA: AAA family ATPase [Roseiflexaceae bacterium]|nr:AAA family ATPase [Roseiflexaceae bacterium]
MPAQHPTLIPLTEAELSDLFGDDADGLRRYQLLHAVLAEGMTQRQAAEAGQVSERTVRNILRAYMQSGGLEALRSRQPSGRGRRAGRPAAFERALAAALAEEPLAGGDRLWRRACEQLGKDAGKLSRRTAYRILAQLRADRDDEAPDSLRGAVRAALPLLPEDPPLALAASALAQRFLPADLDSLPRGTLLQQALRAALDHLRPPGPISTIDRGWWPYLICTGEYEAGQSRAEIQDDLALSASTYSRAKRQGLDRIVAVLPRIIERMIESPLAIASQRLPRTPDFVGRREEQSYYAWRLQTEGLAHIWGLPGSGKTALAAELAADGHRYGQTILWHTCRAGRDSTLLGIIRGLAQALAAAGDDTLWRELRQAPPEELDPAALLDALRERLLLRPAVLILDDAHHADAQETDALLDALADLVARRSIRLLLVGRDPIESVTYSPLPGMIEREAQLLWAGVPALPSDQWRALYAATGGMPEPIRRAAAAYRRSGDMARANDWSDELDTWAREAIWSRLDEDQQRLLVAALALEDRPWAERQSLVCETLGVPVESLRPLFRSALLYSSADTAHSDPDAAEASRRAAVTLYGALRNTAGARLREETQLRERLLALADQLDATSEAQADALPEAASASADAPEPPVSAPVSSGLELLERVRNALEDSAVWLQEQGSDQAAHQLAAELAALRAALPNLARPRLPFGRTVAEAAVT